MNVKQEVSHYVVVVMGQWQSLVFRKGLAIKLPVKFHSIWPGSFRGDGL